MPDCQPSLLGFFGSFVVRDDVKGAIISLDMLGPNNGRSVGMERGMKLDDVLIEEAL